MKKNMFLLLAFCLQASIFISSDCNLSLENNRLDEDQLAELMNNLYEDESVDSKSCGSSEGAERKESPITVVVLKTSTERDLFVAAPLAQTVVTPVAQFDFVPSSSLRAVRSLGTIPEHSPVSLIADSPRNTPSPIRPISRNMEALEFGFAKPTGFALLGMPASRIPGSKFSSPRADSLKRPESQLASASSTNSTSRLAEATTPIGSARQGSCRLM